MFSNSSFAQEIFPLYSGSVPLNKSTFNQNPEKTDVVKGYIYNICVPQLIIYKPLKKDKSKSSVIICPGGGYSMVAMNHEGRDVALRLNKFGITAFVLKYRLPDSAVMDQPEKAPLMDAEKAIWWIRTHAKEYQLDPNKVGIMGFSAGGHLASTLGTHYKENLIQASSTISLRPDFMILCYPVISFENSIVHSASKERLIGKNPGDSLVKSYSNETQVSGDTPPTFLMHAANDQSVNVENSIQFFQALQSKGVKSEIHIYQSGGHGFGLLNTTNKDDWFLRLISWLKTNQFL